jgi:ABC-type transport system involved in multi-copper enzyme maturation permease subunit
VIVIARATVTELVRRRVIWVLATLTVVSVALVGFGIERLVGYARADGVSELQIRIGVSQILVLIAFMFSFVLAMTAGFLGAPAIGGDLESGVALAMLARPIRRADLLLGRWLGLAIVVVAYAVASGAFAILVVQALSGHAPPEPVLAVAFLAAQAVVLLTLSLALGTALPTMGAGAISVVAFGLAWMAGVVGAIAPLFSAQTLTELAGVSRVLFPSDGLWRGVIYGLEPPAISLLANGRATAALEANPFYALTPPSLPFIGWSVAWTALVLALAALRLARREV